MSSWWHTPGTYVSLTSLCCNNRWICTHRHEVELSSLRVPCDFHPGRVLCWHSRQPHRHKGPFICPRMFRPASRHAARCPSGPTTSLQAYVHACMNVSVCVYICFNPSSTTSAVGWPWPPPQPWMGRDSLCGRQEDFTLKCVESARGHNRVQLCVRSCARARASEPNNDRISRPLVLLALGATEASWPRSGQQLSV